LGTACIAFPYIRGVGTSTRLGPVELGATPECKLTCVAIWKPTYLETVISLYSSVAILLIIAYFGKPPSVYNAQHPLVCLSFGALTIVGNVIYAHGLTARATSSPPSNPYKLALITLLQISSYLPWAWTGRTAFLNQFTPAMWRDTPKQLEMTGPYVLV